jgi:hypothetical protein
LFLDVPGHVRELLTGFEDEQISSESLTKSSGIVPALFFIPTEKNTLTTDRYEG